MKVQIKQSKSERGQSLVELGASLVVLLIVLAGLVDLGRLFMNVMSLRDAVQEGALYGSMYPTHCDQIVERTYEGAQGSFIGAKDTEVDVFVDGVACKSAPKTKACAGHEIRVVIRQPDFPVTMPLVGAFIGQSIPLETEITNTILRPNCDDL
jgi:hypothetical protein